MWDIVQIQGREGNIEEPASHARAEAHAGAGYHGINYLEGDEDEESSPPASCRDGTS